MRGLVTSARVLVPRSSLTHPLHTIPRRELPKLARVAQDRDVVRVRQLGVVRRGAEVLETRRLGDGVQTGRLPRVGAEAGGLTPGKGSGERCRGGEETGGSSGGGRSLVSWFMVLKLVLASCGDASSGGWSSG